MEDHDRVAAVVLAAGMSQRMGRLKSLLPFGDRPMLARVLENLLAAGNISPIIVVTGYAAEEIGSVAAEYNMVQTHNPHYEAGGMLSSIQQGVQALPTDCEAFFLVLGDQPGVRPDTLRTLLAAWQERKPPVLLPTHAGKRGHPILLASSLVAEIRALPSETTLKTLITRHADLALILEVADPAILWDVDTPEDYERALQNFENQSGL